MNTLIKSVEEAARFIIPQRTTAYRLSSYLSQRF